MKTCTQCNSIKESDQFVKGRNLCKECRNAYMRDYYSRPQAGAKQRERVKGKRSVGRRYDKFRSYGFSSSEEMKVWMEQQPSVCQICRVKPATHVDHCHETIRPRGLICGTCNTMLGFAYDRPEVLIRAASYLGSG